jgi:ketosteroid isomerase-like protein
MKAWAIGLAVVLVTFAAAQKPAAAGKDNNAAVEKSVADMEAAWADAMLNDKPEVIGPLLADSLVATDSDGSVQNKAAFMNEIHLSKFEAVANSDMKVKAYGNTAIATGTFTAKGKDPKGKKFDIQERFTDTWVKMRDGHWQCVATHTSELKK